MMRVWLVPFLVVLGLILRLVHFLRCPSVWHDEAALIVNIIGKDYAGLLGPLFHHEAGPPLFLWLERAMVLLFGDGVQVMRFPPFLASCLALLVFTDLCRRTLEARALPWAVGLFAVSDRLLWHACEAKPYAFDAFVAVLALWGWERTRSWSTTRQCVLWLPILPVFIWLSYPACFVAGGVVAAIGMNALPRMTKRDGAMIALLTAAVGITFVLLAIGPAKAQRDGAMESCWTGHFPDFNKPLWFPFWTLFSTMEVLRYNLIPFGQALIGLFGIGAFLTWKRDRAWTTALLFPMVLVYVAACLHKYPYGGSRCEVFLAPAMIWLVAHATPHCFDWLKARRRGLEWIVPALLVLPFAQAVYRTAVDWPRADCAGAAAYVLEHREPGEALLINHWEYEYYFRNADVKPLYVQDAPSTPTRFWVVLAGDTPGELNKDATEWISGAEVLETRHFFRARVLRVRRSGIEEVKAVGADN